MNKKFKTLLTAGLITVIAGANVVSSSALEKNTINNYNRKGSIYVYINGVKYKVPLGNINNQNNNNNQENNNTNTDDKNDNIVQKPGNDNVTLSNNNINNKFLSFQKEVVRLVNVERAKVGLKELSF